MFDNLRLDAPKSVLLAWGQIDVAISKRLEAQHRLTLTEYHPVLHASGRPGEAVLVPMVYGLIPSYSTSDHPDHQIREAGLEVVSSCSAVRCTFRKRRCVIPVTSFEVQTDQEDGQRDRLTISSRSGGLLGLAGIWEHWEDYDGSTVESFAILHCEPNASTGARFARVPACVSVANLQQWLYPSSTDEAMSLLTPLSEEQFVATGAIQLYSQPTLDKHLPLQPKNESNQQAANKEES